MDKIIGNKLTNGLDQLPKHADSVLLVGSGPTIEHYLEDIRCYKGECWALNDAWFWLEKNGIDVDKAFITDTRFIRKSLNKIETSQCSTLVTIDTVDLTGISHLEKTAYVFKSLGRDGFSLKYGEVFHGCSVFFCALQVAFVQKYQEIASCGVLFSSPASYVRIDGSSSMPEYVHSIQLGNARTALETLRTFGFELEVFEPESNLNFL